MEKTKWLGSRTCDICGTEITGKYLYDAKTASGPWGTLCSDHFRQHGIGLGTGLGQMYKRDENDDFVKVKG